MKISQRKLQRRLYLPVFSLMISVFVCISMMFGGSFTLQAKSTSEPSSSESLDIYIPVEVEPWKADEENQAIEQQQEEEIDQRNAVTQFELKPIEGAPMPCSNTLTIDGCGKAEFGPIPASEPVDWSYELTEKLISGKDVELVDERIMIIRVETFWDDDGTLFSSITATDAMADPTRRGDPDHPDQSESGKEETVFHIRLESEPSPQNDSSQNHDDSQSSQSSKSSSQNQASTHNTDWTKAGARKTSQQTIVNGNQKQTSNKNPSGSKSINTADPTHARFYAIAAVLAAIVLFISCILQMTAGRKDKDRKDHGQ